MNRMAQIGFIGATIAASWLAMQDIHECGHLIGAKLTGGKVVRVVLNPISISRTDLSENPHPLIVTWAGPIFGVLAPLVTWGIAEYFRLKISFLLRFFAGFCLLANGAYIGVGSFSAAGDCGDLLNHGAVIWQLWGFGIVASVTGLTLWNGLGADFGIGPYAKPIGRLISNGTWCVLLGLLAVGLIVGGK